MSDERLGATKMAASASMNVAACLRSTKQPPQCTVTTWASSPPDCLRTPIPAWTVTYERVQACFRCCMLAAAAPHAHKIAFWTEQLDLSSVGLKHGVDVAEEVLLGHNSDIRFSDWGALYDQAAIVGPPERDDGAGAVAKFVSVQGGTSPGYKNLTGVLRHLLRPAAGAVKAPVNLFVMGDCREPTKHNLAADFLGGTAAGSLRAWFSNNIRPTNTDSRVKAYPRGVQSTRRWRAALLAKRAGRVETRQTVQDRQTLLMCGCMAKTPHRLEAIRALTANGFRCEDRYCSPDGFVDQVLNATFVFSPFGTRTADHDACRGGHNNHRDWEALLAGAIPLVDHDPQLSGMWDDLPVVQVRNWSEVTPRYLRATWHTMRDRQYNLAKVYFPYWLHASLSAD